MPKKLYGFTHSHQPALYTSSDLADGIEKRLDALDAIWTAAASKLKAIESSGNFSPKGKQAARSELKIEVKRQLKIWLAAQDPLDDQMRQLENEMMPKRNRPDDFVGEMRQREVRDYLRTLDPTDIESRYLVAAETGDELFLSAVEESPIPFSFATKGLVEGIRFSRLEKAYPVQAAKLADLRIGKANVISALKSVQNDLAKQNLNVAPDALSQAA